MAHCPYAHLADLEPMLAELRKWPDVREPRPGVFYVRRTPFLHFHIKDGRRWADVRSGRAWGPRLDIPLDASSPDQMAFLARAREAYDATRAAVVAARIGGRSA